MADEQTPEVIRHQMEVQRASLAEKLETLENKIVRTVDGAREAVAETVQTVKDSVQSSVETVRDTVQSSVDSVRDTFDVPRQVQRHPWAMFGGSIALGFAAGWLLNRASRNATPAWGYSPASYSGSGSGYRDDTRAAASFTGASISAPAPRAESSPPPPASTPAPAHKPTWLDEISQTMAPEIQKVKGLAIGAAMGVVRDLINQAVPEPLKPQVNEMVDSVTTKLGGAPMQGHLLDELLPKRHDGHPNGRSCAAREEVPS